jgi:hypothetical protein
MSYLDDWEEWKAALLRDAGLKIVIQDLGHALAGTQSRCLDLKTGAIVPASECPEEYTGDGRPALRQGKRFISIPSLDEGFVEFVKHSENLEGEEERVFLKENFPEGRKHKELREWYSFLREEGAAGKLAMRWIAELRPDFTVLLVDELDDEPLFLYDPASGVWEEL